MLTSSIEKISTSTFIINQSEARGMRHFLLKEKPPAGVKEKTPAGVKEKPPAGVKEKPPAGVKENPSTGVNKIK